MSSTMMQDISFQQGVSTVVIADGQMDGASTGKSWKKSWATTPNI